MNESFGRFSDTGSGTLNGTTAKQRMNHLLHANDSDYPLIQKLLSNPTYKRMYLAHCKTVLLENFDNGAYYETGLQLQATIDAAVQADNNKLFSYNNFLNNLTSDVSGGGGGPGGGATVGITNLMDGRNDYLLGLADFSQTEPEISGIGTVNTNYPVVKTLTIQADVINGDRVYLMYRTEINEPFQQKEMWDNGHEGDGAANDGTYGATFSIEKPFAQYYIYAENENAGKFSPARAAHEHYSFCFTSNELVINEFMASNDETVADQDGEFDDWVELYNNSDSSIDMSGYYLSDDPEELMKWEFPAGTSIEGRGYLTIWADDDEEQEGLHTNFKLSAASESVVLVNPSGEIVDEVSYVDQETDVAYGRIPNGTGNFQKTFATFGTENGVAVDIEETPVSENFVLKARPNPTSDWVLLEVLSSQSKERVLTVFDLNGKVVYQQTLSPSTSSLQLNTADWSEGIYVVQVEGAFLKLVITD